MGWASSSLTIMISEDRVNVLKDILEEDSFLSITSHQYEKSRIGNYNMLQFELDPIFDDIVWTMISDSGIASALHFALALYTRIPDRPWSFERYWSDNSDYIWAVQFDGEYLKCRHQPIIEEVWWCRECDKDNWGNSSEHQKDIWSINTGETMEYVRCKYCGNVWIADHRWTYEVIYRLFEGKFIRYSQSDLNDYDTEECWKIIDSYNNKTGYLDLELSINGSSEELLSVMNLLKVYRVDRYLRFLRGDRDSFCFSELRVSRPVDGEILQLCEDTGEEELRRFVCSSDSLSVVGVGQRGSFVCLYMVPLLKELSDVAPGSVFSAILSGEDRGKRRIGQKGELSNRKLKLSEYYDDSFYDYYSYAEKICPPAKFRKIFGLKKEPDKSVQWWYEFIKKYYYSEEPDSFWKFNLNYRFRSDVNYDDALSKIRGLLKLRKDGFREEHYNDPKAWRYSLYDPNNKSTKELKRRVSR